MATYKKSSYPIKDGIFKTSKRIESISQYNDELKDAFNKNFEKTFTSEINL